MHAAAHPGKQPLNLGRGLAGIRSRQHLLHNTLTAAANHAGIIYQSHITGEQIKAEAHNRHHGCYQQKKSAQMLPDYTGNRFLSHQF